jgi:antitoxin PrlF
LADRRSFGVQSLAANMNGQISLTPDLLQHLGVELGGRIEFEKLPDGELRLRAARPRGTITDFIGLLAGRSPRALSIDEINEVTAAGWAGDV